VNTVYLAAGGAEADDETVMFEFPLDAVTPK
jgi:hypothetical protein